MGSLIWQMLAQDLSYTWRHLARRPGFTAVVLISLTLGMLPLIIIGSIINAVWLRPPTHVRSPERLVAVFATGDPSIGRQYGGLLYPDVIEVRQHTSAFDDVLAYSFDEFNYTDTAGTRVLLGSTVSENYFDLLGVRLAVGRGFSRAERASGGAERVAVIGSVAWQHRFNGDPAVLGKTINLDGQLRTIVGVAPQGLLAISQPIEPEVYLPLPDDPVERRASRRLAVLARLRPEGHHRAALNKGWHESPADC